MELRGIFRKVIRDAAEMVHKRILANNSCKVDNVIPNPFGLFLQRTVFVSLTIAHQRLDNIRAEISRIKEKDTICVYSNYRKRQAFKCT